MLLITNLDGTLLTSQKTISPRTRQALIAFRQDGGLLAACSARPVSSMVRLLRQQQVDTLFSWCAGFNCGRLLEMAGPRIIHAAPLTATIYGILTNIFLFPAITTTFLAPKQFTIVTID